MKKLASIEEQIGDKSLSRYQRRLLQNRKSALTCRLRKHDQLDDTRRKLDKMSRANWELKSQVSVLNALLECRV